MYIYQYILDDLKLIDNTLRKSPNKFHEVMQLPQFEDIAERVLTLELDGELTVNYLKDGSLLLSLVSAVLECNIFRLKGT